MSDDVNYINLERLRTFLQEVKRLIPTNYATKTELNNYFPKSGGQLTGDTITRDKDNEILQFHAGLGWEHGAWLHLAGKDYERDYDGFGAFTLGAHNGTENSCLMGYPDGTLNWNNKNIDVIEEQGDGYIRYSNGLQICWGEISIKDSGQVWGTLYETNTDVYANYPKAFISNPSVSVTNRGNYFAIIGTARGSNVRTPSFGIYRPIDFSDMPFLLDYLAIGRWK